MSRKRMTAAVAEAALVLVVLGLVGVAFAVGWIGGHFTTESGTKTVTVSAKTSTGAASPEGAAIGVSTEAGKQVFTSASCGGCHTLAASGTKGTVGPNLDEANPSRALFIRRVTNGKGQMPSFRGQLSVEQIREVAAYVSTSVR